MTESTSRFLARRAAPALLLAVVLAGCGDREPVGTDLAPSASSPEASGIPDDFPLAQGLIADGDTRVGTPQHQVRGIELEPSCWGDAWPGAALDRLVVQQVGPELSVTRELAVYPDAATAAAVGKQIRSKAADCHRVPATSEQAAMDVSLLGDVDTRDSHVVTSFAETLVGGQPGGSVFVFARVGRAILAVQDSGEWTRGTAVLGIRDLVSTDRDLVARMCLFRGAGC